MTQIQKKLTTLFLPITIVLAFFLFLGLGAKAVPLFGQGCVEDYRSCDENNVCCNFPEFTCQDGYCKPRKEYCGEPNSPCCEPPNPPCIEGYICQEGYCQKPTTPTPTPSCGQFNQSCCTGPSGDYCLSDDLECLMGTCMPNAQEGRYPSIAPTTTELDITCDSGNGVQTALGCIPTDPMALIKWIFPYLLGLGGLVAFSLIVFSGIRILTSAGNPEAVQGAKETITSAVTGLLFIILSLFLLRLIGVDILQLPGLE